jgi:hypothetical protein
MTETQLDIAHARMEASPGDDALRLAFYNRLAEAELFLLLSKEATGDTVDPEVFDTGEGRFVLTFDRETRLTDFTGTTASPQSKQYRGFAGRSRGKRVPGTYLAIIR